MLKNKFFLLCNYVIIAGLATSSLSLGYDPKFIQNIHNEIVNNFELPQPTDKKQPPQKRQSFTDKIKLLWTKQEIKKPDISPRQMLEISIDQMSSNVTPEREEVVDFEVINKLELLQGAVQGSDSLVDRLTSFENGTTTQTFLHTTIGLKSVAEMISMPTTNIQLIRQRQAVIKELINNTSLLTTCVHYLQQMKKAEYFLYALFDKNDLSEEERLLYPGKILQKTNLNEIPFAVSLTNVIYAAYPLLIQALLIATPFIFYKKFPKMINTVVDKVVEKQVANIEKGPMSQQEKDNIKRTIKRDVTSMMEELNDPLKKAITPVISKVLGIISIINSPGLLAQLGQNKAQFETILNFQEYLINIASYFKNAQKLFNLLASNQIINQAMPTLRQEEKHLAGNITSDRFNKLQDLLQSPTFEGPGPSYFSSPGNILIAYKLFSERETRSNYRQLMQTIGEIDTYVTLAQKVKAHEQTNTPFCFAQFDQENSKPYIQAKALWNPFLSNNQAITNDFSLNTGNEQNILLTGPNTSGKSTFLKAVIISLIMAQTVGIAPAASFTITPFAKIVSYLNITDNVKEGVSQFKAEVLRAEAVAKTIENLPSTQFAFIGIDEMFTGTAPKQAKQLSYNFIKHLNTFSNVLFINATHFGKLTELEQKTGGKIRNYHLGAEVNAEGKVTHYTRKLVPGKATINSAEQVAKEGSILGSWLND